MQRILLLVASCATVALSVPTRSRIVVTGAATMQQTIDKLTMSQSGGFFNYDGVAIPW